MLTDPLNSWFETGAGFGLKKSSLQNFTLQAGEKVARSRQRVSGGAEIFSRAGDGRLPGQCGEDAERANGRDLLDKSGDTRSTSS